jgi:formate dehydrogenase iron-sulfur subunit
VVADIFRTRVLNRGKGSEVWGWGTAYGKPVPKGVAVKASEVKS